MPGSKGCPTRSRGSPIVTACAGGPAARSTCRDVNGSGYVRPVSGSLDYRAWMTWAEDIGRDAAMCPTLTADHRCSGVRTPAFDLPLVEHGGIATVSLRVRPSGRVPAR